MARRRLRRRLPPSGAAAGAVLLAALATGTAPAATEQALRCEFDSGLRAVYIIAPSIARVRRPDVRPVRRGRLEAEPGDYRLVFDTSGGLRAVTIIDRETGALRRVFGARERMRRRGGDNNGAIAGLVRQGGTCRTRFGSLQ